MATWWNTPRAVTLEGTVYSGGVDANGHIVVQSSSDTFDRVELLGAEKDDHNTPALLVPPDRPPLVAYARHGQDSFLRVRVGNTIGDLTSLGAETALPTSGPVTYAQLWQSDATVYLTTRTGQFDTADPWVFFKSNDYGDTWGAETALIDRTNLTGGYIGTVQVGSTVRVAIGKHPTQLDNRVWYCEINVDTGAISIPSDGSVIGNLDGTNLPLDPTIDCDLIYTAPDTGLRLLGMSSRSDANGGPAIGVVTWNDDTAADNIYRYIDYDGGAWTATGVCEAGSVIGQEPEDHYHAGVEFPWDTAGDELLVAREAAGTWYLERWTLSGSTWTKVDTYRASSNTLARPFPSYGGGGFVYCEVEEYPAFTDYVGADVLYQGIG